MANKRIKDITDTATAAASDDYLVIDGATNGTRKILSSNVGGGEMYDYASSWSSSGGLVSGSNLGRMVYGDVSSLTTTDFTKIRAYIVTSAGVCYQLSVYSVQPNSTYTCLSIWATNRTPYTATGTLHFILPFEATSDSATM